MNPMDFLFGWSSPDPNAKGLVPVWNISDEVMQVQWVEPPKGTLQDALYRDNAPGLPPLPEPGSDEFPADATDVPPDVREGNDIPVDATDVPDHVRRGVSPNVGRPGRLHTQTGGAFSPEDVLKVADLDISYIGDRDNPYGTYATRHRKPFEAIVFHYTGSDGPVMNSAKYGLRYDPERKGQFGYHYYIDHDGAVIQGAPLSKRTNHILPNNSLGLSNSNAIGISLAGSGEKPTEAQIASAKKLVEALRGHYGIANTRLYGHGEVNSHKDHREGSTLVRLLRGR